MKMFHALTSRVAPALLAATLLVLAAPAARAQSADTTKTTPPAPAAAAPTGSEIRMSDILPVPSADEMKRLREDMKALDATAQVDLAGAKEREARYRAKMDIRKSEVEATKKRIDMAKKDQNKELQATLEATKKRQEAEIQLYQKMADMEKTNGEVADAARQYARARQNAADLLEALGEKYNQRQSMLGGSAPEKLVQVERQVRESEKKTLEAQKEAASKQSDWTGKQKDAVDRRMDAFNALAALLAL